MRTADLLRISARALLANKARSGLTMLGIIIGIASVILMIAVGESAQRYLLSQVASFGSDLVYITNGKGDQQRGGPPDQTDKQTLTLRDFKTLKALPWTKAVSGEVITNDLVSYGSESKITTITGSTPDEIVIYNMQMDKGRFLDQTDVDSHSRVVVMGTKIAQKLFGEEDPVGRTMKVSKQTFRIIGVLKPSGTRFFTDMDNQIYMPFTTAFDVYNKNRLNFIAVKTGDVRPKEAKELIRIALRENHNINNPNGILSKDDFRLGSQEDAAKNADTISTILQILLSSIAGISLFVAGIGIMNIMYVTVTERTREIGLRKSIGARTTDILRQFLAEAVALTAIAGLIGVAFGFVLAWSAIFAINQFQSGWVFTLPWKGAAIGFLVSTTIGIVFGYFPARKAARLNAIEALRYE